MEIQNPSNTQQKSDFGKQVKLFLIEAGILALIVVIAFLVANYLNIIKLDSAYPALSFLPHRPRAVAITPTPTGEIATNQNITPVPAKGDVVSTPTGFAQDRNNAKNILIADLKDELLPKYIPSNLSELPLQTSANAFSLGWTDSRTNDDFQATVNFVDNSNIVDNTSMRIMTTNTAKSFDDSAANSAVQKYFTSQSNMTWSCSGSSGTISCQTIFDAADMKKGFRIIAGESLIIISCSIPKSSPTYNQGCFNEKAVLPK